jgi:phage N-6-adenine-methyltransferase
MLAPRGDRSLEHYDPEHGLKTIAVAEVAERHFRRAKDATRLMDAVEAKLTEQRRFVLWWDGRGHDKPGRPGKKSFQTGNDFLPAGKNGLPDSVTIHRWRIRLKADAKYEATLQAAQERCRRVCEAERGSTEQRGASGTGENEWHTPKEFLSAARDVLGEFDLDPASTALAQLTVRATRYFTRETDGLQQPWHGRVWLNPPYAQPFIASFVLKLVTEVRAGRVTAAILLTHNYTDTTWFHEAASACAAICFTRGRVRFVSPSGELAAPTQGQAFFYFGTEPERFAERFATVGFVVTPARARGAAEERRMSGWTKHDRFAAALPPLDAAAYQRLKDDIAAAGEIRVPIEVDQHGRILDGHHRLRGRHELGEAGVEIPEPETVTRFMPDEDQAVAYVIRANLTRRQLSPEQLGEVRERQREVAQALREGGKTQAETAAILGVARTTIEKWETPDPDGSNDTGVNASPPDRRLKLSPDDYEEIYRRAQAGETHEQIAADFKVSRRRVGQVVELVGARQREPEPVETPGFPKKRYRCLEPVA